MDKEVVSQFNEMLSGDEDCVLLVVKNEDCSDDETNLLPTEFLEQSLNTIKHILEDLVNLDPVVERSTRVQQGVLNEISCYQHILDERFTKYPQVEQCFSSKSTKTENRKRGIHNKPGVVRHTCKHCEVSFTTSRYLEQHQNICLAHKTANLSCAEQPLHCTQCGRSFSTPYNHKRHMVKHIINNKHFPCVKRLKMVDINQEDIENAAQILKTTKGNITMQQIAKDLKIECEKTGNEVIHDDVENEEIDDNVDNKQTLESDVNSDEDGEITRGMSDTNRAILDDNNEEGEVTQDVSTPSNKQKEKYQVVIVDNKKNTSDVLNSDAQNEDITKINNGRIYKMEVEENDVKFETLQIDEDLLNMDDILNVDESSSGICTEKHKLDIISDHVLQRRKKYWTALELTCVSCGQMFMSPEECDQHLIEKHHGDKPFICNYCDWRFLNITQLNKHTSIKHKVLHENNSMVKKNKPMKHVQFQKQISIKIYSCRVCHLEFNRADILKSHERRHLGIVKSSKDGELLLTKQKHHTGAKPPSLSRINCRVCGGSYSTRANLKKHMAIHDGNPRYFCQHCGKTFLKSDCLRYHLRTHTKERPWTCSICSESFTDRRSWLIHLNNHKGLRPYKCEACPMTFVDRRHLNKHIFTTHENKFKPKPVYQIVVEDGDNKQNLMPFITE